VIFDGSTVGATAVQVADVDGDGDADVVLRLCLPPIRTASRSTGTIVTCWRPCG
jgi:hypothetical protein